MALGLSNIGRLTNPSGLRLSFEIGNFFFDVDSSACRVK